LKGGRQQHLGGRCRRPPATKPSKVPAAPRLRATPLRGGLHLRHARRPRHAATLPRGSPRLVGRLLHCSAAGVLRCAAGARALLSAWAAPSFPVQAWFSSRMLNACYSFLSFLQHAVPSTIQFWIKALVAQAIEAKKVKDRRVLAWHQWGGRG